VLTLTDRHQVTADEMRLHPRVAYTQHRPATVRGIAPLPDEVVALLHQVAAPFAVALHAVTPADVPLAVPLAAITRTAIWTVTHMPATRDAAPSRPAVPKVTRTRQLREQGPARTAARPTWRSRPRPVGG
jgi:hypothetical protein